MQRAYPILNFKPLKLKRDDYDLGHKEIYTARSNIVHGKKRFAEIHDGIRRRAFYLARDSILHIIRDDAHRHWFSKADTSEKDRKQVMNYVQKLGNATERPDDEPPKH